MYVIYWSLRETDAPVLGTYCTYWHHYSYITANSRQTLQPVQYTVLLPPSQGIFNVQLKSHILGFYLRFWPFRYDLNPSLQHKHHASTCLAFCLIFSNVVSLRSLNCKTVGKFLILAFVVSPFAFIWVRMQNIIPSGMNRLSTNALRRYYRLQQRAVRWFFCLPSETSDS